MKKKLIALSSVVLGFAPFVVLAQAAATGTLNSCVDITEANYGSIEYVLCKVSDLLNMVVPILLSLAVIYFVWGVIAYVISDDEEAKKKGRNRIVYGIIGLFVIVAVWGLVALLRNTFGLNQSTTDITYPTVPY